MLRVLLASADTQLVKCLEKELNKCTVKTCDKREQVPETVSAFDPDVVLLDTQLLGENIFAVARGIRQSFRNVGIAVISTLLDDCTVQRLAVAGVNYIIGKPCKVTVLVSHILEIGYYVCGQLTQDPENTVNSILLDLGFRMGLHSYLVAKEAVLAYCRSEENVQMKNIYYKVMKRCGGSTQQKEKALRDGIKIAAGRGDPGIWRLYFPAGHDGFWKCPTNEEFIARIATCLRESGRLKMPYEEHVI